MDDVTQERKKGLTGQMSLFDFADEEDRQEFEVRLPNVGEYSKEELLTFEKEVLGVYISGHPLEAYMSVLQKNTTADTLAFQLDEETGEVKAQDGDTVTLGGMIAAVTRKTTKTNTTMAFLTLEDLLGTAEIIVFPRDYEKYRSIIAEDAKVLIKGRVSAEEDKAAKLICTEIISMDDLPRELWIRFMNKDAFLAAEENLYRLLSESDGKQEVVIYLEEEHAVKRLPKNRCVEFSGNLLEILKNTYGEEQIKVVDKKR
jgi:DNA polymerase-3 subunit alpha